MDPHLCMWDVPVGDEEIGDWRRLMNNQASNTIRRQDVLLAVKHPRLDGRWKHIAIHPLVRNHQSECKLEDEGVTSRALCSYLI